MRHLLLIIEVFRRLVGNYKALERIRTRQVLLYDEGKFDEARELDKQIIERHISISAYQYIIDFDGTITKENIDLMKEELQ